MKMFFYNFPSFRPLSWAALCHRVNGRLDTLLPMKSTCIHPRVPSYSTAPHLSRRIRGKLIKIRRTTICPNICTYTSRRAWRHPANCSCWTGLTVFIGFLWYFLMQTNSHEYRSIYLSFQIICLPLFSGCLNASVWIGKRSNMVCW